MRILEVVLSDRVGGAERLAESLADEWRKAGHRVDVVKLDAESDSPEPRILRRLRRLRTLRATVRYGAYDVIHAHTFLPNAYARAAVALSGKRVTCVITLHSGGDDYRAPWLAVAESRLARWTDAVVCVSKDVGERYAARFPRVKSKLTVIPNGVRLDAVASPRRYPEQAVAVARLSPEKDIVTLLRGFDEFIARSGASVQLDVIGSATDPAYASEIAETIDNLRHRGSIRMLGPIADAASRLNEYDFFVHSARYEAHPMAVIEAAAIGLPIVATDIAAVRDIVGRGAALFPPGDIDGCASAIVRLEQGWGQEVDAARRRAAGVRQRYAIRSCSEQYLKLFARTLEDRDTAVEMQRQLVVGGPAK